MTVPQRVVVGSMTFLALLTGCRTPPTAVPAADLLLFGGRVHTLEEGGAMASSVAIAGGRIVAIGVAAPLADPATRRVDLAGRVVVAAFVDHHVHLLNVGLSILNSREAQRLFVDLGGAASPQAVAERLAERAEGLLPGSWILGKGWSQGAWGATTLPTHEALTAALPEHPVFLTRVDGHAGWLNQSALVAAGIDASTPDPPGGAIVRLPNGKPSGVLLERANELVLPLLPQPTDDDVATAFRLACEALVAQGVSEVYDAGFLPMPGIVGLNADLERWLRVLVRADRDSPLPLRVHLMVPAPSALASAVLADPQSYRSLSSHVGVTHLKLFADGALGSRGAALSRPFADDPAATGVARMTAEEITALSFDALEGGLDVAVHAIGDAAIHRTLDVFEELLAADADLDPGRLRLEHVSFPLREDIDRAAALGVVLSVQPDFVAPGDDGVAMEDQRIGAADVERVYAWASLRHAGGRLAFGSDYFTALGPPLLTLHAAVTRQNAHGLPLDGWHPAERLPRAEALAIATTLVPAGGGAGRSRLALGGVADLVVLSGDPLAVADAALLDLRVEATIVGGRVAYSSDAFARLQSPPTEPGETQP